MMIQCGKTYKIVNVEEGTVLDLFGIDRVSLLAYKWHSGDNQKWVVEQDDEGWRLKSVWTGHFVGVDGLAEHGTALKAVTEPFKWDILPDEENVETFRVFVPNTRYNLDLSSSVDGTPVRLMPKWHPGKNQTWRFEEA